MISRKADILECIPQFQDVVQRKDHAAYKVISINNYTAFGCDITDVKKLEYLLSVNGLEPELPTLLLAECVLSYIDPCR